MADAIHWTDETQAIAVIFAVAVAMASAGISWLARGDSKKAAIEAASSKKIAKADLLAPHFSNVRYLLDVSSGKKLKNDTQIELGLQSFSTLVALTQDNELKEIFKEFPEVLKERVTGFFDTRYSDPVKHNSLIVERMSGHTDVLERKRLEYLNIG